MAKYQEILAETEIDGVKIQITKNSTWFSRNSVVIFFVLCICAGLYQKGCRVEVLPVEEAEKKYNVKLK
jgi:hypothetical protein